MSELESVGKSSWTLDHELGFLSGLGNHSSLVVTHLSTRFKLLHGYRIGLMLRNDDKWTAAQLKMLNDWVAIEMRRELAPKAA